MSDNDDALLSIDDAAEIGFKVVEMADRVRKIHQVAPGTRAKWRFDIDDVSYDVLVCVSRKESG